MAIVTVIRDDTVRKIEFDDASAPLAGIVLADAGILVPHPCGGRGVCGKCAAEIRGTISPMTDAEKSAGTRLLCQTRLLGDSEIRLSAAGTMRIETNTAVLLANAPMLVRFGAAVDIGTTTIALKLYDTDGRELASAAAQNPQCSIGADVMSRIEAAMNGRGAELRTLVTACVEDLLDKACAAAGIATEDVDLQVIAGNTTMLYLLTGRDPTCLSAAPFEADTLFGSETTVNERRTYLPHCMNAFVGADITCAVIAAGMCRDSKTSLLCDIGTNGEIALWKNGVLYVTSTAAGPAFEGAGISCGCGSVDGAVDRVWVEDGIIVTHTIGNAPAVGICGSGLIDAVAAFLDTGIMDETGAADGDLELGTISLIPADLRAVQLAKAAIAAGIRTLLQTSQTSFDEVATLYIAGGFGSHLNVKSAVRIGLLPAELADRVKVIGNGSLTGAAMMLLDQSAATEAAEYAGNAKHVNLGGSSAFNANFIEEMIFPEE